MIRGWLGSLVDLTGAELYRTLVFCDPGTEMVKCT